MQRLLYLFSFLLMVSCAQMDKSYVIEGKLSGTTYDGEFVFLVPIDGATAETVDSVQIQNGSFRFEGDASDIVIRILRTRPLLRLELQELLVVTEPGIIDVVLDSVSVARGTPQNEALQKWKERKRTADFAFGSLNQQIREADENKKAKLKIVLQKFDKEYSDFNYNFVKENKNTAVGKFVYKMTGFSFTPEQKKEIDSL